VKARLQMALVVVVLVGVGMLLGSFWLEWRHVKLVGEPGRFGLRATPATLADVPLRGRVRVEVLNGSGDAGAARTVAEWLRTRGFDVVTFGNAARFGHAGSEVLDRSVPEDDGGLRETRAAARAVADSLGISRVRSAPNPDLFLDATVVLGKDWRELIGAGKPRR